jgi:hypothetical protein
MELSTRHCKDGKQSLRWQWSNGSRLRREGLAIDPRTRPSAGMEGGVYCEEASDSRLAFRLGTASGPPAYEFHFGLNFTGWRMFRVQFERDCRAAEAADAIETLEILPPGDAPTGCVYLDSIAIGPNISPQRSADYQMPAYAGELGDWWRYGPLHFSRLQPTEPLPATITESQTQAFATISRRYRKWLMGENPDLSNPLLRRGAEAMQDFTRRGWEEFRALGLKVDSAGWITGPGLQMGRNAPSFYRVFYDILLPLAFDFTLNSNAAAKDAVLRLFDYVYDQGWAEGSANGSMILNELMFAAYCHALALMREALRQSGRLERAVRVALWYLNFGKTFLRFDQGYLDTNADELRSTMLTSLTMVLAMDDSPRKVQYMRGWRAWFNSALEISPRFTGVFKPDGVGFHHRGIYAGTYATEAYEFSALIAWLLHGTEFAPASRSLTNLKQALIAQDVLSHKYDVPYATMGRMPHPGVRVLAAYAYLALASDPPHPELAGIFMRLWDPESGYLKTALTARLEGAGEGFLCHRPLGRLQLMLELADRRLPATPPPQGFWSKPWGALAIHRRDNWLVSVKGWSQYVWDFECHPKAWAAVEENVFARYWSYGTLQPIMRGNPVNPVASGWNLDKGWGWCRWPGATAPHLALSELHDPKTTWECRFFSAATFVGGVSGEGRNGMFALKLHEHYYDPTFRAFKTYFFFDDTIVCLGSNIETRDGVHRTETTLFQCWMSEEGMPVQINGQAIAAFPHEFRGEAGKPLTLLDPHGNGYYLPDGGAVRLTRATSTTRPTPRRPARRRCAWSYGAGGNL